MGNHITNLVYLGHCHKQPAGIGVKAGKIWRVHRIFYQENVNVSSTILPDCGILSEAKLAQYY